METISGSRVNIGIIGVGHWGPNHVRVFSSLPDAEVSLIADRDTRRLEAILSRFSHIDASTDYRDMLNREDIDAVVISTPTATHFEIAGEALESGKDVLCEKPLAITTAQCETLIEIAGRKEAVLMVGHPYMYNPCLRLIKDLIVKGELGELYYFITTPHALTH